MMKPSLGLLGLVTLVAPAAAQTPTVKPGWPVTVPGASVNGVLLANLDADADLEVVVASGSAGGAGQLNAFDPDGSVVPGWPFPLIDGNFAAPAFGDIDGDGEGEVVVTTFFFGIGGDLVAVNADGSPVPGFPLSFGGTIKGAALADLDGDDDLEIVVGFNSGGIGTVYALQGDGSVMPGWPRTLDTVLGAAASIGDLDDDGVPEIFIPSYEQVFGFRPDGTQLPGFPFDPGNEFINYNTITLVDLNGDGDGELVMATSDSFVDNPGAVWVVEHTGVVAPGWPRPTNSAIWAPPAVADIDGDGSLDVALGDQLLSPNPVNRMYAWDKDGVALPGFPVLGLDAVHNQTTIADVDGDGEVELLYDSNVFGQGYYALNHDGTPVAGWPLPVTSPSGSTSGSFNMQLSVADVDGDGLLDIAGCGGRINDGLTDVFLWSTTAAWDEDLAPVATHMYGPTRAGVAVALDDGSIGTGYCTSTPNSTGSAATIDAFGSTSFTTNDLTLVAGPVPATPGLFYYGPTQGQVPFGNGFRCVGGQLSRLSVSVPSGGVMTTAVDLLTPPTANGQITPGSVWNFQAWFRDPAGGGAGFDLSDAVEVTFTL